MLRTSFGRVNHSLGRDTGTEPQTRENTGAVSKHLYAQCPGNPLVRVSSMILEQES